MFVQLVLQVGCDAHPLPKEAVDLLDVVSRQRILSSFLQLVKHDNFLLNQRHALLDLLSEAVHKRDGVRLALSFVDVRLAMVDKPIVIELVGIFSSCVPAPPPPPPCPASPCSRTSPALADSAAASAPRRRWHRRCGFRDSPSPPTCRGRRHLSLRLTAACSSVSPHA
eukprot:474203-Hanusia_phi.AAC.1